MRNERALKERIYQYILKRFPEPVGTAELEDRCRENGYTGRNGIRRTNELVNEGKVKRIEGKYARWTI